MTNFNFNMTSDDYDRIDQEAKDYQKEYKESGFFGPSIPVCFLTEGTFVFRIYPDRDSQGFIRLFKRVWTHSILELGDKRLRFWSDERVNKLIEEVQEAGMEKLWGKPLYAYRSREQGYMMAHFYECPETKYMKQGNSYCAVLTRRQMFAIQDFIAELHPEDKRQILDPNNAAPGIKMQVTKGAGKSNVSAGIASMQRLTLPELEFKQEDGTMIEYKGLDHVYITENDKLADEDFFNYKNGVYTEIANFKAIGGAKDMSAEAHKIGQGTTLIPNAPNALPAPTQLTAPSPAQSSSPDEIRCRLAEAGRANPKTAAAYPNAAFGNKPSQVTPYCLVCEYGEECAEATKKKAAA